MSLDLLLERLSSKNTNVKQCAIDELAENYKKVIRIRKLARLYHTNEDKIRSILKENNIKIGNYGHRKTTRRFKVDEGFFSRDNESSFYWAGFIAADGWVNSNSGYALGIELNTKDHEHLVKFKEALSSNVEIKYRERTDARFKRISCTNIIHINSKKIFFDLARFNIVQRKTYIYDMPQWLKEHALVHHFIRGYIDGDGCFSMSEGCVEFSMHGTVEFLRSLHEIIYKNGITKNNHVISASLGKKYKAFDYIKYGGNNVCSKLYDYLYNNATIYLERKRVKLYKAKELVTYGTGKRRKKSLTRLNPTKEELIRLAGELKTYRKIGEYYGCTAQNIRWHVLDLGIEKEVIAAKMG